MLCIAVDVGDNVQGPALSSGKRKRNQTHIEMMQQIYGDGKGERRPGRAIKRGQSDINVTTCGIMKTNDIQAIEKPPKSRNQCWWIAQFDDRIMTIVVRDSSRCGS
jgi:hypothetical protein